MHGALAILRKDLRIEWRTRESITSFAALGVLLLVVFTGLLGVQRAFLLEREQDCLSGLLGAPIDPGAIYAGKLAANIGLLAAMQALVVPLVGLFLHVDLMPVLPGLTLVLLLGNVGFASLATLFAAVAVRTRAREVMLPLLLLPLLTPLLIGAVVSTRAVLAGGLATAGQGIGVLAAFDVIFTVAGWLLFTYVVRD